MEELIPLYVEGDLDPARNEEMIVHLKSCERCSAVCDDLRESQEWLRAYATPQFDADFFDSLKRGVLTRIEREQPRPSFFQLIARHWRLNTALATATALLLVFGAIALYIYQNGAGDENRVKDNIAEKSRSNDEQPPAIVNPEPRPVIEQPAPRPQKRIAQPRPALARSKGVSPAETDLPLISENTEPDISETEPQTELIESPVTPPGMMRIEIQTSDPTIRIIWFTPKEADSKPKKSTIDSD
jgi:anti-sigma factor RsiW